MCMSDYLQYHHIDPDQILSVCCLRFIMLASRAVDCRIILLSIFSCILEFYYLFTSISLCCHLFYALLIFISSAAKILYLIVFTEIIMLILILILFSINLPYHSYFPDHKLSITKSIF